MTDLEPVSRDELVEWIEDTNELCDTAQTSNGLAVTHISDVITQAGFYKHGWVVDYTDFDARITVYVPITEVPTDD